MKIVLDESLIDSEVLRRLNSKADINRKTVGCPNWIRNFYRGFLLFMNSKVSFQLGNEQRWAGVLICGKALDRPLHLTKPVGFQALIVVKEMLDTISYSQQIIYDEELKKEGGNGIIYLSFSEEVQAAARRESKDLEESWFKNRESAESIDDIDRKDVELILAKLLFILRILFSSMLSGNDFAGTYITDEDWDLIDQIAPNNNWGRGAFRLEGWLLEKKRLVD